MPHTIASQTTLLQKNHVLSNQQLFFLIKAMTYTELITCPTVLLFCVNSLSAEIYKTAENKQTENNIIFYYPIPELQIHLYCRS